MKPSDLLFLLLVGAACILTFATGMQLPFRLQPQSPLTLPCLFGPCPTSTVPPFETTSTVPPYETTSTVPPFETWSPPTPLPSDPTNSGTKIIESFHVKSDIRYRFATTQISSVVRNAADFAQEIAFDVVLPKEAFIVSFSMEIDGKKYDGVVKEKSEAKKDYQRAVDKGQSAGHIRQAPRHSNIFEVSVNVGNGSAVNFTLTYQEILRRKLGVYDHEIHINPGQPVEDFLIEIYIQENREIKFIKTPALRTDELITNEIEADNPLAVVDQPTAETAHIFYKPPLNEQGKDGLSARFSIQYDVEHSAKGDVLVVDGYFIHFFAPDLPPMPKDIIFVLDVSGSMQGTKIEQLKNAMITILNDLQPDDRFNIITFSSYVNRWKSELMAAKGKRMNEAKQFVQGMRASGMTDINSALLTGISELKARENKERAPMIFFLTDGVPTSGVQNLTEITGNVIRRNENMATIFSLAFGEGADFDFLKTLSAQNAGFARKIYEASDSAMQVTSLYEEISAVVMKDISVNYLNSSVDEFTLTKRDFPVIFNGSEVIICGFMAPEADVFKYEITGLQKSGEVNLVLEVNDVDNIILTDEDTLNPLFTMPRDFAGIVERMWAFLTIKQLLRETEKYVSDELKVKELKDKILQMSPKYNFVTPLTSMVVTMPENPEEIVESLLEDADNLHSALKTVLKRRGQRRGKKYRGQTQPTRTYGSGFVPVLAAHPGGFAGFRTPHFPNIRLPTYRPSHMYTGATKTTTTTTTRKMKTTTTTTTQGTTTTPAVKISNAFHAARLMTVIAHVGDTSICFAPRKVKPGVYQILKLARGAQGSTVKLVTQCGNNCRHVLLTDLIITKGSKIQRLTQDGQLVPFQSQHISQRPYSDKAFKLSAPGVNITVSQPWRKRSTFYSLEVFADSPDLASGLLGDTMNLPQAKLKKWQKKRQPRWCRNYSPDIASNLFNKMARKYLTVA